MDEAAKKTPAAIELDLFRLVMFQTGRKSDPSGDFNHYVFQRIQDLLDRNLKSPPRKTAIDVWLESPGGSASSAYKIFLELSTRCRRLRFVIPDYAKSAATLLALGGDKIYMAAAAELGPLDAQIEHPDREGVTISALDSANSLAFMAQFAADFTVTGGLQVLDSTQLPRLDVLREFSAFAANVMKPVLSKLDPHLTHHAKQELELAKEYAKRILCARNIGPPNGPMDEGEIAEHLVSHYPAHEFIVSRTEARGMGLPIVRAHKYDKWAEVKKLHRHFRHQLFTNSRPMSIIQAWAEPPKADEDRTVSPIAQGDSDGSHNPTPEGRDDGSSQEANAG